MENRKSRNRRNEKGEFTMIDNNPNRTPSKLLVPQPTLMTADELWKLPEDEYRYELVKGEIRQRAPAGIAHGIRTEKLASRLSL